MAEKKLRILFAKAGPDTHVRGITILLPRLRDAGYEVIYTGLYQTPESIVAAAIQEDVDFVFLSSHLSGHMALSEQIMKLLKQKQATGIELVVGGLIPKRDFPRLKEMGVKKAFMPMTLPSTIMDWVKSEAAARN
jgi:methylmalonyl-CoA mutase C-terminal domain/subunit